MIARILILIILAWALYQIIRRIGKSADSNNKSGENPDENIVQCAHCGCFVPETESQLKHNKISCNNPQCQTLADQENRYSD